MFSRCSASRGDARASVADWIGGRAWSHDLKYLAPNVGRGTGGAPIVASTTSGLTAERESERSKRSAVEPGSNDVAGRPHTRCGEASWHREVYAFNGLANGGQRLSVASHETKLLTVRPSCAEIIVAAKGCSRKWDCPVLRH